MHVIRCSEMVQVSDQAAFLPMVRYVVHQSVAGKLKDSLHAAQGKMMQSHFNSYERRYAGQNTNGKRIMIMRSSAFGDTLMATAIPCYIRDRFPETRVDVWADPKVADLWMGLGFHIYHSPVPFDAATQYAYHLILESMFEANSEAEQNNAYDDAFAFFGMDPKKIPDRFKRPHIAVLPSDGDELKEMGFDPGGPYIVYQMEAANPNRSYPPLLGAALIRNLLDAFPNHKVVLVGMGKRLEHVMFEELLNNERVLSLLGKTKKFRSLIPVVNRAELLICPDSSIGHLSAALDTPTISLWGLFHPDHRVKYYHSHTPLFAEPNPCPHAPCLNHEFELPQHLCKDATNAVDEEQRFCNALRGISPEMILETARGLVK